MSIQALYPGLVKANVLISPYIAMIMQSRSYSLVIEFHGLLDKTHLGTKDDKAQLLVCIDGKR